MSFASSECKCCESETVLGEALLLSLLSCSFSDSIASPVSAANGVEVSIVVFPATGNSVAIDSDITIGILTIVCFDERTYKDGKD